MAKMWINPDFQKIYIKSSEIENEKEKKYEKKPLKKSKLRKKVNPAEEYINKKIQERKILQFKFIDNDIITGIIQWADQRYLKIRTTDKEGLVIEKKSIKYIK